MKVLRVLGYLWAVPVTLVGLLLALLYLPRSVRWRDGALELLAYWVLGPRGTVGVTFGWVIMYSFKSWCDVPRHVARHERVHVAQCLRFGPFMLLAYPVASFIAVLRGGHYYRDNWFETQAYGA